MSFGGWYLFTLRTVTVANVPVLGDLQTVTESRMVAHFVEEGGQIQGSHEVCGVDVIGATTLAETILPEAFVRALPTSHYTLDLSEDEGVHGISGDLALVHIGYNPSLGPVPSNSQDANVLDTDDDGLPGATVVVRIPLLPDVHVYVAQRSQVHIEGTWTDGRFEGASSLAVMEQSVLGSNHPLFTHAPVVSVSTGDFVLEPLEGPTRCKDLEGS